VGIFVILGLEYQLLWFGAEHLDLQAVLRDCFFVVEGFGLIA
jgi:hypothetical protein